MTTEAWMQRAACRPGTGTDPETFFPLHDSSNLPGVTVDPIARRRNPTNSLKAKKICRRCEVRDACLAYALARHIVAGVYGGLSERERRRLVGKGPECGTIAAYREGCRCADCLIAKDEDVQGRKERRAGLHPCPSHLHGSEGGYTGYRCRCERCCDAHEATLKRAQCDTSRARAR